MNDPERGRAVLARRYAGLLFDMDGTLLSSIESANRVWSRWGEQAGIDRQAILSIMHGVRAVDTMRRLGVADPEGEAARLTEMEIDDVAGTEPIAGAAAFLAALGDARWAIVTSAPRALATARLAAAGLPQPPVFVTAEDVAVGKPHPEGYRLAAERLGIASADCLVLEDAPAGIEAGLAAGASVLVVTATHGEPFEGDHASIEDYRALDPVVAEGMIGLRLAA